MRERKTPHAMALEHLGQHKRRWHTSKKRADIASKSPDPFSPYPSQHKNIIPVSLDVDQLENIEPALANIGDVDLLVNNAGIAYLADFVDHDIAETEKCVSSFSPLLLRKRPGIWHRCSLGVVISPS